MDNLNSTCDTKILMSVVASFPPILTDFLSLTSIFGITISIVIIFLTRRTNIKQMKLHGLHLVFEKLNDPETSKTRWRIFSAYAKYLIDNNLKREFTAADYHTHTVIDLAEIQPELQDDISKIKSQLEEIAILTKHGFIDENAYFDAFGGVLLRCYIVTHGNINNLRIKFGSQRYTKQFEDQTKKALEYWKKNYPSEIIRFHYESKTV